MPEARNVKTLVVFYSMYGHVYRLAEAVAEGAREVEGAEVSLRQVAELVPDKVLEESGAKAARQAFAHVPLATVEDLTHADAILFGTPTRFGMMCTQMRNYLDQTGKLWFKGALIGKVGGAFSSTASQHGGQETTLTSFHATLMHHGMIVVGVPYSEPRLLEMSEMTGGTPYGASTITGPTGSRLPSDIERAIARFQGRYATQVAQTLLQGSAGLRRDPLFNYSAAPLS